MDCIEQGFTHHDLDLVTTASLLSQFRFLSLGSEVSQQQEIIAPFTMILERFRPQQFRGEIEIFDGRIYLNRSLSRREYQYMQRLPMHSHNYLELMLVLSGSVLNRVGEQVFPYTAGQGCMMNPKIRHKEEALEDCEVLFVALRPEFLQELTSTMDEERSHFKGSVISDFLHGAMSEGSLDAHLKQYLDFFPCSSDFGLRSWQLLCEDALTALREKQPGDSYLVRAALLRFLTELGDPSRYTLQEVSSIADRKSFLVSKVDLLLRASHGRIPRHKLEEKLAYNADYLNRIYRQLKGRSIAETCRETMLHDAQYLLKHSDVSVDEIIQILGITSRSYFFSLFRKDTGMTPKEYRAQAWSSLPESAPENRL